MSNENITYFEANRPAQTLISTVRSLFVQPRAFFADMPVAIFYRNSVFFVSIVVFVLSFLAIPFYGMMLLFLMPAIWGVVLIALRFLAAYLRWGVSIFAKKRLSTVNAYQLAAYAFLPMLFSACSWFGLAALLWSFYLLWLGLIANCRIKAGTALTIVAVPASLLMLISGVFVYAMSSVVIH
ncbi:MAG: YIP1 family protein [Mariprofundaceae bacterium]|nr:YIP1 family protein [Mariprofundaceae bacterium]